MTVGMLGLVAACAADPALPAVPSEVEARAHLDSLVALVASGQAARICEFGSGTCRHALRGADPAAIPRTRPVVVRTRVIDPTIAGDQRSLGGRVLELCGIDGLGQPYASELLVFHDGSRLISTGTPYWLGIGIAESPTTGADVAPACPSP